MRLELRLRYSRAGRWDFLMNLMLVRWFFSGLFQMLLKEKTFRWQV